MDTIYADYNSTVPVSADHLANVLALIAKYDGNPSSIHREGRSAKVALENARGQVASLIGSRAQDILFTSGATESNNIVIQGVVGRAFGAKSIPHVVVTTAEHSSVLEPVAVLEERGQCTQSFATVGKNCVVDADSMLKQINSTTALVCLIYVNNETGSINPVEELAALIKAKSPTIHVHVDAVQALGKLAVTSIAASKIDSMSLSGHKIGAFKGIGALYLKSGVKLNKLTMGGGQERSRRPGTENLPGILSFGLRASELAKGEFSEATTRSIQTSLNSELKKISGVVVHGLPKDSVANTINFHVDGVAGDDILLNLDLAGISASSGSACSSGVGRPSHVLKAMGYDDWVSLNSVRISLGVRSRMEDVPRIIEVLKETISRVTSS